MRRSIATVSISGTLDSKLESIARARFDGVEIFENDLLYFNGSPREVRQRASDLGLSIDLYQPFRDFEAVPKAQFKRNLDRAERKFDLMGELGAPMMLVCSNVSPLSINDSDLAAAQLYEMAERAGRRGIRLAYESLAWGRHVSHYKQCWDIVAKANHPHLGLCLDSFHILSLGDDPAGIEQIPGEKIFFLQLADAPLLVMDVLQWSRHYRCFPGQGMFDLPKFLEHVLVAGYDGPLSLEIFNDVFREASNRRTAVNAMQSLLYLEEKTRARLAERQSDAALPRTLERFELFAPPSPPQISGTNFIEFAVDDETESALGRTLEILGFANIGLHRSKHVTLFHQGDINLVVNNEPGSFAQMHFQQHGPSVCAMALRVDDARRAVNRAQAFQVTRFEGRIGPHETTIPAILAEDGSIIYFVSPETEAQDFWSRDFTLQSAPSDSAGLLSVDHIAMALPFDRFDTGVLYYRAVLGLEPGESLELADPYGLVRSRAVSSPGGEVRMALNVSQSRGTLTGRSVSAQHGAGVHHIAFACEDIFVTAAHLRENGLRFLNISQNYYDDLPAKFDISDELLDRLRGCGVLYDRSEDGEFFHLYTELFADRFFFEVVQRVGNYSGYGAANAPVRMAAQALASAAHVGI